MSLFCTWNVKNARAHTINKGRDTIKKQRNESSERERVGTKNYTPIPTNKGNESDHNYEVRPKSCKKLPLKLPQS